MRRSLVYDPVMRTIHWWNALSVMTLLLTGEIARRSSSSMDAAVFHEWHAWFGNALVLGLVARLVWGLFGPRYARLSALFRPHDWGRALKRRVLSVERTEFGPHPLAGSIHLLFYAVLIVVAATGLSLLAVKYGSGPLAAWLSYKLWLKSVHMQVHDFLSYVVWAFVFVHVSAVVLHDRRYGTPLAQSMLSGYQYLPESDDSDRK